VSDRQCNGDLDPTSVLAAALADLDHEAWIVARERTVFDVIDRDGSRALRFATAGDATAGRRPEPDCITVRVKGAHASDFARGTDRVISGLAAGSLAMTGPVQEVIEFLEVLAALAQRHAEHAGAPARLALRHYRRPAWLSTPPDGVPQELTEVEMDQLFVVAVILVGLPARERHEQLSALWSLFAEERSLEPYAMTRLLASVTDLAVGNSEHEHLRNSQSWAPSLR
jgi:hypothetical protein